MPTEVIYVSIHYTQHETVTQHRNPDDQWSGDSTALDISVQGISRGTSGHHDITVTGPKRKTYWLVWVRYGTGDSFHTEDGRIEFMHLCKNEKDAKYLVSQIESMARRKGSSQKTVKLPSGESVPIYPVWDGYFERFESAEYEAFDLR